MKKTTEAKGTMWTECIGAEELGHIDLDAWRELSDRAALGGDGQAADLDAPAGVAYGDLRHDDADYERALMTPNTYDYGSTQQQKEKDDESNSEEYGRG